LGSPKPNNTNEVTKKMPIIPFLRSIGKCINLE
jgi:hypothetical protein